MMRKDSTLHCRLAVALLVALSWLPSAAWAQGYATVSSLAEPDARGRWGAVQATAAAARIRGDERTPLEVGLSLQIGDQVQTTQARVELALPSGETITISEGADLTLGERSVIQRLGEVYYQVRDVFKVDYGTVQTAVEGTEFTISGADGPVQIAVTEGAVRVTSAGESVLVKRGQVLAVAQSIAPGAPTALGRAGLQQAMAKAWTLGRPKVQLGLMAGGGLVGTEAQVETRSFASMRLLPGVNLVGELGLGGLLGQSTRVPANMGLEMSLGGFSVGGSGQVTVENKSLECGGKQVLLHLGGAAHVRYQLPLSRRLFIVGGARAGFNGATVDGSGQVGVGVSL